MEIEVFHNDKVSKIDSKKINSAQDLKETVIEGINKSERSNPETSNDLESLINLIYGN